MPMKLVALLLSTALSGAAVAQAGQAANPAGRPAAARPADGPWAAEAAQRWYAAQPWLVGANYLPASAINQLEMFNADTFDPARIDRELSWAKQTFGMNVMRVYLHDLLHLEDPEGLKRRMDELLTIAARHDIRILFVLFDSCWNPDPVAGRQHPPIPGVHNGGWVQSPSRTALVDPAQEARLQRYVEDIVGHFANDRRVLAWDVWNEPDNSGGGSYNDDQLAEEQERIAALLPKVFRWARSRAPSQPLTSGVWIGDDWSPGSASLTAIQRTQLAQSDIITFHNYEWPEQFERRIAQLRPYGRPIVCTEWLARGAGSNVETILPIARRENVGMINWGLVDGKSQTRLPWDSWERPYTLQQPTVWFHDLLHADGTPYRAREAEVFRAVARSKPARR